MTGKRRQIYINSRLQFRFSAVLVILVTVQSVLAGWLIYYAVDMLSTFRTEQRLYTSFTLAIVVFAAITVFNIFIGAYLSHKIAGPIYALQQKMKQIRLGDISRLVEFREGDELSDVETDMNEMIRALQRSSSSDREAIRKASEKLKELSVKLKNGKADKEALGLLEDARASLKEACVFFKAEK